MIDSLSFSKTGNDSLLYLLSLSEINHKFDVKKNESESNHRENE